jgi:hypothetical protein
LRLAELSVPAHTGLLLLDEALEPVLDLQLVPSELTPAHLMPLLGDLAPLVTPELPLLLEQPQVLLSGPLALSDGEVQEVKPALPALLTVALGRAGFERLVEEFGHTGPFLGACLGNHFPEDLVLPLSPLNFGLRRG